MDMNTQVCVVVRGPSGFDWVHVVAQGPSGFVGPE
jgi:hypothetical protein